jgi:hypothetical protein
MPGNAKSDIKLGFFIGIGLLLLGILLTIAQLVLGRAAKAVPGG